MSRRKSVPLSITPSDWLDFELQTKEYAENNYNILKYIFKPDEDWRGKRSFRNTALLFVTDALGLVAINMSINNIGPLSIMNTSKTGRFVPFKGVLNIYKKTNVQSIFDIINMLGNSFAGSVVGVYALLDDHAVAILAWADAIDQTTFHFGIYDPLGSEYDNLSTIPNHYIFNDKYSYDGRTVKIITHQLSKYCPQFSKGYRCPQYYYDYDYCHMYVIQFLFHIAASFEKDKSNQKDITDIIKESILNSLLIKNEEQLKQIGRNNTKTSVLYNVVIINVMCLFVLMYYKKIGQFDKNDNVSSLKCGVQLITNVVSIANNKNPNLSLPIYNYILKTDTDCDTIGKESVIYYSQNLPKNTDIKC